MDWIRVFTPDLWILSIIILIRSLMIVKLHPSIRLRYRWMILIPAICLALLYGFFEFVFVDLEWKNFSGRIVFIALMAWEIIILFVTRKHHYVK